MAVDLLQLLTGGGTTSTGPSPFDVQADPAAVELLRGLAATGMPEQPPRHMRMLNRLAHSFYGPRRDRPAAQAFYAREDQLAKQDLQSLQLLQGLAGELKGNVAAEQQRQLGRHEFDVAEQERARLNEIVDLGQFGEGWEGVKVQRRHLPQMMSYVGQSLRPMSAAEKAVDERAGRQLDISEGHYNIARERADREARDYRAGALGRFNENMLEGMVQEMILHSKINNEEEAAAIAQQIQSILEARSVRSGTTRSPIPQIDHADMRLLEERIRGRYIAEEDIPADVLADKGWKPGLWGVYWVPELNRNGTIMRDPSGNPILGSKKIGTPDPTERAKIDKLVEEELARVVGSRTNLAAYVNAGQTLVGQSLTPSTSDSSLADRVGMPGAQTRAWESRR